MLNVTRSASVLMVALVPLLSEHVAAHGAEWRAVLLADPGLRRDANAASNGNPGFATTAPGKGVAGAYDGPETVHVGTTGGSRLVAIPLDSGGSIGYAGWLIYRPGVARHLAVLSGSNGLFFKSGDIVTDDAEGDSVLGNADRRHRYTRYRFINGQIVRQSH